MTAVLHPRPNPIVAAMYTLRDLDVDVIIIHGPSGCGFMASRMLEEAGVRVVTTSMNEKDLIFGAYESMREVLERVEDLFGPSRVGVVGTCASMIIGEDLNPFRGMIDAELILVDVHGCMGDNTTGAIRAMEAAEHVGIIDGYELNRQKLLLEAATTMERDFGMASKGYIRPTRGPTKHSMACRIIQTLEAGGSVDVIMNAKKELAYRFADINLAIEEASRTLGGDVRHVMNVDPSGGLPRIRRYAEDILSRISSEGLEPIMTGALDEYAVTGDKLEDILNERHSDLRIFTGIPHAYMGLRSDDLVVTDQPRILAGLLDRGFQAVGEIASHSMVMGARDIIPSETGDTIRELIESRVG